VLLLELVEDRALGGRGRHGQAECAQAQTEATAFLPETTPAQLVVHEVAQAPGISLDPADYPLKPRLHVIGEPGVERVVACTPAKRLHTEDDHPWVGMAWVSSNASISKPSACFLPRARRRDRFGFRSRTQRVESIQNRERRLGFTEGQGIAAHQVKLAGLIDQPIDLVGQGGKIVAADGDALLE